LFISWYLCYFVHIISFRDSVSHCTLFFCHVFTVQSILIVFISLLKANNQKGARVKHLYIKQHHCQTLYTTLRVNLTETIDRLIETTPCGETPAVLFCSAILCVFSYTVALTRSSQPLAVDHRDVSFMSCLRGVNDSSFNSLYLPKLCGTVARLKINLNLV